MVTQSHSYRREKIPVRRLVLLTAIGVVAIVGVAYAVDNTLTYTGKISHKGTPTTKKPSNTTYTGTVHIDTNPPGQQPDIAPTTTIFFAKAFKVNAKYFPFCLQAEIDGQPTVPAKCAKAKVGSGTAKAYPGNPGSPKNEAAAEPLTVAAYNGAKNGTKLLLVVNGSSPVLVQNRVIPGTIKRASGTFGTSIRFDIPADLQHVANVPVSLTDFSVKVSGTPKTFKVSGKTVKASYLQLTSCPGGHLPTKAITVFTDSQTGQPKPVTSTSASKC